MRIQLRASSKKVSHVDRFGTPGFKVIHTVEAFIGGVSFYHECQTAETARALVERLTIGLEQ
jgi:hypothetical protein